MAKIKMQSDDRLDSLYPEGAPARVSIRTKAGKSLTKEVIYPRGHAKNPLSEADVLAKFHDMTAARLSRGDYRQDDAEKAMNLPVLIGDDGLQPFAPSLAACGIAPQRLLWVRCAPVLQRLWACEQALRCLLALGQRDAGDEALALGFRRAGERCGHVSTF